MKLNEIQDLIKFVAKSGVSEVELEMKDVKIIIKSFGGKGKAKDQPVSQPVVQVAVPVAPPVQQVVAVAPAPASIEETPAAAENDDSKYVVVKSPMIGTFYRLRKSAKI